MADQKPTSQYYQNLGGINQKSSDYSLNRTEFQDIRNMDFFVPNALSKRPGMTGIASGITSSVKSIVEFQFLSGSNYVFAGQPQAFGILNSSGVSILSQGASTSVRHDGVGFLNRFWFANGQSLVKSYNSSQQVVDYPVPIARLTLSPSLLPSAVNFPIALALFNASSLPTYGAGTFSIYRGFYAGVYEDGSLGPLEYGGQFVANADRIMGTYLLRSTLLLNVLPASGTISYPIGVSKLAIFFSMNTYPSDPRSAPEQAWGPAYFATNLPINISLVVDNFVGPTFLHAVATNDSSLLPLFGIQNSLPAYTGPGGYFSKNNITTTNRDSRTEINVDTSGAIWSTYSPKFLEISNNRMAYAGDANNPNFVWISDLLNPINVPPENFIEVRTNDGDAITGLKQYNTELLIFKRKSFYRLLGDSPSNYSLSDVSTEYGCLSDKTIVEFREKVAWLDRQGVMVYNGASYDVISTPIEETIRRMNYDAAQTEACAVHFPLRNQLWFAIPIDGSSVNNVTLVYDYIVQAWTIFDGFSPASFAYIQNVGTPQVYMGNYSGAVRAFGESYFSDAGQAFTAMAFSRFEANDGQNMTHMYRRHFLDVAPRTGVTGVINVEIFKDYDSQTVQATFQAFQSTFQTRNEMGVMAKSVASKMSHANASLPLQINGFGVARRFLRNV